MPHDHALLTRAFELAATSRASGDHPFGALLAVGGNVVAEANNRVNTSNDITAHAELTLVRVLQQEGNLHLLAEGTVYTSCEPCPMCVGAMFWAGARHIVYGLSAARLSEIATPADRDPFRFVITAPEIGRAAMPPLTFEGPQREDEAAAAHLGYWVA